jgi:hypothetical protein
MKQFDRKEYLGISYFLHPLPLASVALLAANDHYLKFKFPGFITGKLSDFSGVFFFPLFLCALFCLLLNGIHQSSPKQQKKLEWVSSKKIIIFIAITDFIMLALKLYSPSISFYAKLLHPLGIQVAVTRDPTDLISLTMNLPTYIWARKFWQKTTTA